MALKSLSSRERENHTAHLASIEAELDSQVTKVGRVENEKIRKRNSSNFIFCVGGGCSKEEGPAGF